MKNNVLKTSTFFREDLHCTLVRAEGTTTVFYFSKE